jgi:hypothetical protein
MDQRTMEGDFGERKGGDGRVWCYPQMALCLQLCARVTFCNMVEKDDVRCLGLQDKINR